MKNLADIETQSDNNKSILRFTTIGSVDNGKSTLIGRLLHDSKAIFKNHYEDLITEKGSWQNENINLAFLTDGLRREREEGITIDVAYRYFSTPKRKFIIADSPGHLEYTRNMVTGSSKANSALVLIDAENGMNEQIKRHTIISSLLRIPHITVCINKMDLVDFDVSIFESIRLEFIEFAAKLQFSDVQFIPISALHGDNVVNKSDKMPWYKGPTLIYLLENLYISSDRDLINCRLPVQYVINKKGVNYIAGLISGGVFKKGDEIIALPYNIKSKIIHICIFDKELSEAFPPMSITMTLEDDIAMKRGDMLVRPNNYPVITDEIDAMLCWFDDTQKLETGKTYKIFISCREIDCKIESVIYKLEVNTLHRIMDYDHIKFNDIARIRIRTHDMVFIDPYSKNKLTGSFILIDKESNNTVAAGMVR
ncbi:MAG: sulfate adenylyltransferase [Saprospiraceae bacterium]|nr:sulfate adenylyltransferase [Saprospiraceae bacterium]